MNTDWVAQLRGEAIIITGQDEKFIRQKIVALERVYALMDARGFWQAWIAELRLEFFATFRR
jgi:hypothetical protein